MTFTTSTTEVKAPLTNEEKAASARILKFMEKSQTHYNLVCRLLYPESDHELIGTKKSLTAKLHTLTKAARVEPKDLIARLQRIITVKAI